MLPPARLTITAHPGDLMAVVLAPALLPDAGRLQRQAPG